ncbi:unnamed protein product [Auanema sp. JU1783]|nr:unnamed protein product [Auanema sp. JU1783]
MSVQVNCKAEKKMTIAIRCDYQLTTVMCDSSNPKTNAIIYAERPDVNMKCTAYCLEETIFWINATLKYLPSHVENLQQAKTIKNVKENWISNGLDLEFPHLGPLLEKMWYHWEITIGSIIGRIFIAIILINLIPKLLALIIHLINHIAKQISDNIISPNLPF